MKVALHPLGVDGERFAGLESPTEGGVLLCFPGFWAACAWVGLLVSLSPGQLCQGKTSSATSTSSLEVLTGMLQTLSGICSVFTTPRCFGATGDGRL